MRAVIWTDVFQFVIMMGGMLAILIKVIIFNCNAEDVVNWFGLSIPVPDNCNAEEYAGSHTALVSRI
jgi:Na+(H+)/acetate symporter ActP